MSSETPAVWVSTWRHGQADTADRRCLHAAVEAGDHRTAFRDCRLDHRQREGGLVTCLVVPYLRNPERVGLCQIGCDDVAETSWHVPRALHEDRRELIPASGRRTDLADQAVHLASDSWCCSASSEANTTGRHEAPATDDAENIAARF